MKESKISLYPDQEEFIQDIRSLWKGHKRILANAATAFGKTRCAAKIIEGCVNRGMKVCFVVPRISLIEQTARSFYDLGLEDITFLWGSYQTDYSAKITIASVDTLIRREKVNYDLTIVDECFTGDIEILTEKGWVRFDELGSEKVAQSDIDGNTDFVVPKKIKKKYSGEMVKLKSDRIIDLDCTAGHELVVHRPHSKIKPTAKEACFNCANKMLAAGPSEMNSDPLSIKERLLIATQADGSIHNINKDETSTVYFSFAKQRKIDRLHNLCEQGGYGIKEVSSRAGLRRFSVKLPYVATKNFSDWVDLNMSSEKASNFLHELVEWDGHKAKENRLYYSSVVPENVDIAQAVSVLAGFKSNKTIQYDQRKESYKPVHRLFIATDKKHINTGAIKKEIYSYSGDVYCVRVPKGNIFVRRSGKPVLIGNCHHRRKTLLEWMNDHPEERYIGLTATAFSDWLGTYYTAMAKSKSMAWLIENGRLAPYDVFAPTKPNLKGLKTTGTALGTDYKESDLEEIMGDAKIVGDVVGTWLQRGENRLTIALCVNIAHAGHLTNEFNRVGVRAELISHHVPVHEREAVFKRALDGITKIILSVDCLTEGFDMPEATCLINARPTKSKARFIQGIGRILRFIPNKRALILDHAGSFLDPDLGFVEYIEVEDLCNKSDGLDEVAKARKEKEKKEKKPIECKKCTYLKPPGILVCPKCGHKPIAGENIEVDEERELVAIRKEKKPQKEDKQKLWSELKGYQAQRQMTKPISDGALAHIYKARVGVWPRKLNDAPLTPSIETLNYIKSRQIAYAKRRK